MYYDYLEEITFKSISTLLRDRLKITYIEQADAFCITEKTLQRWRNYYRNSPISDSNKSPYKQLSDDQYDKLLFLLESNCTSRQYSFSDLLKAEFPKLGDFQDDTQIKKIIINSLDYHIDRLPQICVDSLNNSSNSDVMPESFIKDCLNSKKEIASIYMAFQSGADWIKRREKENILRMLISKGIPIYVLVNDQETIGEISDTMNDPIRSKTYIGFDEVISIWNKYSIALNTLSFRISNYPLFRKAFIVNFADKSSEALIRDYAYGHNTEIQKNIRHLYNNDSWLKICKQEFELLWDKAIIYTDWIQKVSKHTEEVSAGKYVLVYLSHQVTTLDSNHTNRKFIFSTLNISENNKVKLQVNLANTSNLDSATQNSEYTYFGSAKLTRNNLFYNLYDESKAEQINITIKRPLHDFGRYIGIMTGLSTQAQPVAFKCAIFEYEHDIMKKINFEVLSSILNSNNKNWTDSLMIIEDQDLDIFYSNKVINSDYEKEFIR